MRRLIPLLLLHALVAGAAMACAQGGPPFITDDPGTPGNRRAGHGSPGAKIRSGGLGFSVSHPTE